MQTPTLGFWFLALNAVAGTRTGFALLILLLAVGGALVAVSALGNATGASLWVREVLPPAAAVIGFVLGGMLLGLVHTRTPKDERTLPGRATTGRP